MVTAICGGDAGRRGARVWHEVIAAQAMIAVYIDVGVRVRGAR